MIVAHVVETEFLRTQVFTKTLIEVEQKTLYFMDTQMEMKAWRAHTDHFTKKKKKKNIGKSMMQTKSYVLDLTRCSVIDTDLQRI